MDNKGAHTPLPGMAAGNVPALNRGALNTAPTHSIGGQGAAHKVTPGTVAGMMPGSKKTSLGTSVSKGAKGDMSRFKRVAMAR